MHKPFQEADRAANANHSDLPSSERIYQAVRELRASEQIATRETVAELSGLKLSIVDDRLRNLVDEGRLKRLIRGVFELVECYPPPRPISKTLLPDGFVKLEIGDDLLTLSPQEDRALALLQAGAAAQAQVIETGRAHLFAVTELASKVESQGRVLRNLSQKLGRET